MLPELTAGLFGLIVSIGILLVALMALLLPFFVLRIRNEVIAINKKIDLIVDGAIESRFKKPAAKPGEKNCGHCGARNRAEDYTCMACGEPLAA